MTAVSGKIEQIVQQVGTGGANRKRHEQQATLQVQLRTGLPHCKQGGENEQILNPPLRTQRAPEIEWTTSGAIEQASIFVHHEKLTPQTHRQVDPD